MFNNVFNTILYEVQMCFCLSLDGLTVLVAQITVILITLSHPHHPSLVAAQPRRTSTQRPSARKPHQQYRRVAASARPRYTTAGGSHRRLPSGPCSVSH